MGSHDTFKAYLYAAEICNVDAINELSASKIRIIPDQSDDSSEDLQRGQIFPTVIALHFLQASSLGIYSLLAPFFSFG